MFKQYDVRQSASVLNRIAKQKTTSTINIHEDNLCIIDQIWFNLKGAILVHARWV